MSNEPDWSEGAVDAEVVEVKVPEVMEIVTSEVKDCTYKPNVTTAVREARMTGNLLPMVNAMRLDGASAVEIREKVTDVTVSGCLKRALTMPNAELSAGDVIVNNADALGQVLLKKAMAGDMAAIREVLNRTEGKVPNVNQSASVKVTGDAGSIGSLMAKIDQNKG